MHREHDLFVMAGLSPVDSIKGCTYNAAKILQDEDEYGSIQEGLSADVLIVDGNPAENISDSRNVRYVFMQRKQIDLQSLTRQ
jgi:imidazolonepropionase-like amidohydrolase